MYPPTFTVKYPRGFADKGKTISQGVRVNNYTNNEVERYGCKFVIPSIFKETSITLPLETLISTFNNIINKYKLNPDTYLTLNSISKILTNEESVVKYALVKLNGTNGRCVSIKNSDPSTSISYPIISYNPILKETKQYLLILFNRFINYKDKNKEDIIIYEEQPLFIHLFTIIIDSFHFPNPDVQIKKDCTDTFAMITLLELLVNKKHKNIINFYINNIPLPLSELEVKINDDENNYVNNDDSGEDNEWDNEDFELLKHSLPSSSIPLPKKIIDSNTYDNEYKINLLDNNDKYNEKTNETNETNETDEIPDNWDTL